jgi:hypothetical protein
MAEPNSTLITAQDSSTITISKSALQTLVAAAGSTHTPSANDHSEKIFASIVLALTQEFSQENWNSNADQNLIVAVSDYPPQVLPKTGVTDSPNYVQRTISVICTSPLAGEIDPDNY